MSMMVCLALFMGVQAFPPPTFEYRPEEHILSSRIQGYYSERRHTAVTFVDSILVRAHEAVHHLQHMNNLPYDEQQAWDAAHHFLINCNGQGE